jgi:hypothetical protein
MTEFPPVSAHGRYLRSAVFRGQHSLRFPRNCASLVLMIEVKTPPTTLKVESGSPQEVERLSPLENGECLNATEFLRRYEAMPNVKKAELIQGIVYIMASPVSLDHGEPDSLLQGWILNYAVCTIGVKSATNATTKLSPDDVPQPDGLLRLLPEYGGQSHVSDSYLQGAPELGIEIAASSSSIDANAKKTSYRRAGMLEYVLWRTRQGKIDWWKLVDDDYQMIEADENGIMRSSVFPGLWLDPQALLGDDGARVLEVLNQGLASPEHAAFVEKLGNATSS